MPDVFISYSRKDMAFVRELKEKAMSGVMSGGATA